MEDHIAYKRQDDKICFLTKDKKVVDNLCESAIMHYVTLTRIIGINNEKWEVVKLKDLVLDNKDIIAQLLK